MPTFTAGDRLGPYEILCRIGAGGMGEVWKARDTRLGREVAIKVSTERFSDRFEREARLIATLNHPNICTLYDVGALPDGLGYLVMELIEGPTLAERIKEGVLAQSDAFAIAQQIIAALEAAHEKGVVHRDLKPGNIKIKPDGAVKVLDFGLAKATGAQAVSAAASPASPVSPEASPTISMAATHAGVILGTAAYMSPEQARGKVVDKRADIWSFGVVLYEMLTGTRPFRGEDLTETLASVVKEEPRLDQAPAKARRLLRKCLEKDPKRRLRDIGDAWELLEDGEHSPQGMALRHTKLGWVLAVVAAMALAALLWAPWRKALPAPEVKRYQIPMRVDQPEPLVEFALSPDGSHLAYLEVGYVNRLWLQSLDSLDARAIPGWEVGRGGGPDYPFWSPDSQYIAFASAGKLKKASVSGGPPQIICDVGMQQSTSGSWNRDGVILVSDGGVISRVSDNGGTLTAVVAPHGADKRGGFYPFFLPDGRHFLYYGTTTETETGGVYIGSLDAKPETQDTKPLLAADAAAIFAADPGQPAGSASGYVLFARDRTLLSQRFDATRLQLAGEAVPAAERVGRGFIAPTYSASANGVLIYHPGARAQQFRLSLLDRKGNALGAVGEPASLSQAAISPDSKRVALVISDFASDFAKSPPTQDLWISDLRGVRTRLTFGRGAYYYYPVWSPDGRRIAFGRNTQNSYGKIYWKSADGAGDEEPLAATGQNPRPTSWSSDGRYLLYDVQGDIKNSGNDIWVLPLDGNSKPFPFLSTMADEYGGSFSPDGRWVAYVSSETGSNEIYVRPFPPSNEGKWLVSRGSRTFPRWRQDGKELGYLAPDGSVMSVSVSTSPVFQPGEPTVLFKIPLNYGVFASAPDRSTFVLGVPVEATGSTQEPFTVVLNWMSGLKK